MFKIPCIHFYFEIVYTFREKTNILNQDCQQNIKQANWAEGIGTTIQST